MGDKRKTFKKSKDIVTIGLKTILAIVLVSIILPLFLDKFIFGNNIISNITNGEWASFLGSLFGGVIGGIGTLVAVLISIREERNVQYKNARPILILDEEDLGQSYKMEYRFIVGYGEKTRLYINIKNIGIGVASNIEVVIKLKNGDEAIKLFKNPIAPDRGLMDIMVEKTGYPFVDYEINYDEPLEIRYEDFFGHKYITKYKLDTLKTSDISTSYSIKIGETIEVGKEIL